jgi:hypothetical protein
MLFMHTEEKQVTISFLLRIAGTLTGALLGALAAAAMFFVAIVFDFLNGATAFQMLLAATTLPATCLGFAHPRRALDSLWFLFPELCERH